MLDKKKLLIWFGVFIVVITLIALVIDFLTPPTIKEAEKAGGESYAKTEKQVLNKTPMVQDLPVSTALFNISYGLSPTKKNDPTAYAIFVTITTDNNKVYALEWMTEHGYKPGNYEIIYKIDPNYENNYLQNLPPIET